MTTIHLHNPRNIDNRDPSWVILMSSIYIQAIRDAHSTDPLVALDAVSWLLSPDAQLFLEAIGMEENAVIFITSGRARTGQLSSNFQSQEKMLNANT